MQERPGACTYFRDHLPKHPLRGRTIGGGCTPHGQCVPSPLPVMDCVLLPHPIGLWRQIESFQAFADASASPNVLAQQVRSDSFRNKPGVWGTPVLRSAASDHASQNGSTPGVLTASVANPLAPWSSTAAHGFGLVRSYFAQLNRFCISSPIVAVPASRIHCYFDQEVPL